MQLLKMYSCSYLFILQPIAIRILCIPPASCTGERLFSTSHESKVNFMAKMYHVFAMEILSVLKMELQALPMMFLAGKYLQNSTT
jgi:hypothetical protein